MGRQRKIRQERRAKRQVIALATTEEVRSAATQAAADLTLEVPEGTHCDDYIDDPAASTALRTYLAFARAPAHGALLPAPHPRLFANHEGRRVRVTMASRFGDVGITTDLDAEYGYQQRVLVRQLENFSEEP